MFVQKESGLQVDKEFALKNIKDILGFELQDVYKQPKETEVCVFNFVIFDFETIVGLQLASGVFKKVIKTFIDDEELKNNTELLNHSEDV